MIVGTCHSRSSLAKNTTETQVRSRPTPAVGCAESYIQIEDPNDDTVFHFGGGRFQ